MNFQKKTYIKLKQKFDKEENFSKWLATDGTEYLEEVLGIDLSLEGVEVKKYSYETDIVYKVNSKDENEYVKVVVENQYGQSDHRHFSKLITYAVSNEAKYAVWIVEEIHPEHKRSIDWLNKNTNENINFYVLKAVIEQIGNSDECSFSLIPICEPDDEMKIAMSTNKERSKLNIAQLRFWEVLNMKISEKDYKFRGSKPRGQHWYTINLGTSKCSIVINILSLEKKVRIDLWIGNDKSLYYDLLSKKEKIELEVGRPLLWDEKENANASSVSYLLEGEFDVYDDSNYEKMAVEILDEIKNHFYKIVKFVK